MDRTFPDFSAHIVRLRYLTPAQPMDLIPCHKKKLAEASLK
jgi:hypothetical protein